MPVVRIGDYDVRFPFEPYPAQVAYMTAVIESLDRGDNALLESPTGTGKTLCLLCATLAWVLRRRTMVTRHTRPDPTIGEDSSATAHFRILYCSRTHAQLTQVVRELKRATRAQMGPGEGEGVAPIEAHPEGALEVTMAILGSREHMCVNSEVSRLPSAHAQQSVCNSLRADKSCRFFYRFQVNGAQGCLPVSDRGDTLCDMEEIVREGRRNGFCPYYLERDLAKTADIVLMPYNYILDPQLRKQLPFELTRSCILIVDEAHNVPSVLSAAGCLTLQPLELASAIQDCTRAIAVQKMAVERAEADERMERMRGEEFASLKILLARLETCIASEEMDGAGVASSVSPAEARAVDGSASAAAVANGELVRPGEYVETFLAKALITREVFEGTAGSAGMNDSISNAIAALVDSERPSVGLPRVQQFLSSVFSSPIDDSTRFILRGAGGGRPGRERDLPGEPELRSLGFWRLDNSAELAMLSSQLRCMLLTSGTLSPLEHFAAELGAPFPVRLSGSHVIAPEQVLGSVLCRGPTGDRLNGSYAFRASVAYRQELGMTLVNVSRVTPGGTLVFFPSYTALRATTDLWRAGEGQAVGAKTVWGLLSELKPVFVEPSGSADLAPVVVEFQKAVRDSPSRGAILLAVCRGKVSEGVDFADDDGRCVLVTGIPFANHTDLYVRLKRDYLNAVAPRRPRVNGSLFTGDSWYRHEAMRAVNQSIGRVIRHKDDHGAIVLADERFAEYLGSLPAWVAARTAVHRSFRDAYPAVASFFMGRHKADPPGHRRGDPRTLTGGTEEGGASLPVAGGGGPAAVPHSAMLAKAYAARQEREASAEARRRQRAKVEEAGELPSCHMAGGTEGALHSSVSTPSVGESTPASFLPASVTRSAAGGVGALGMRKQTLEELTARHAAAAAALGEPVQSTALAPVSVSAAMGSTSKEFCAFLKERVSAARYDDFKVALRDIAQLRGGLRSVRAEDATAMRRKFAETVSRLHSIFSEAAPASGLTIMTEFGRHIPEELRPLYAHTIRRMTS